MLSHALANPGQRAVIDDGAARRAAQALNILIIGILGTIIRTTQSGFLPSAVPVLQALQAHGFHLDDTVIREALAQTVGEKWP